MSETALMTRYRVYRDSDGRIREVDGAWLLSSLTREERSERMRWRSPLLRRDYTPTPTPAQRLELRELAALRIVAEKGVSLIRFRALPEPLRRWGARLSASSTRGVRAARARWRIAAARWIDAHTPARVVDRASLRPEARRRERIAQRYGLREVRIGEPCTRHGDDWIGIGSQSRTAHYRGAWKGWSSTATTTYLVGPSERVPGGEWRHAVTGCSTIADAIRWIWDGRERAILARQGDVAVVSGGRGLRDQALPSSHAIAAREDGSRVLLHAHHAPVIVPAGCVVRVGRRAHDRVGGSTGD